MNVRANSAVNNEIIAGLIINPVAGLGGPLGLKGTDGEIAARALAAGAAPRAGERALITLKALAPLRERLTFLTGAGDMGERTARQAGFRTVPLEDTENPATSAEDTIRLAAAIGPEVALLVFVGGDGTAHDVMRAIGEATPALGVPAGVKMHSGVFATTPQMAGQAALEFLRARPESRETEPGEVLDRAPEAPGDDYNMMLLGVLQTPKAGPLTQNPKAMAAVSDEAALDGACARAAEMASDSRLTIVGPGSTMRRVKRRLGDEGALLGVDVFRNGELIAGDVSEADLLGLAGEPARIIVSPIGGQGFLFGRGNQQISAEVIRRVGLDNIVIVASGEKLIALGGQPLVTDTGDAELDAMLTGYRQILTGRNRKTVFRIGHPQIEGGAA